MIDTQSRASAVLNLRHDALASVVVFLVALPLCLGIALASGVPPSAGIVTGIIGGLVVGLLGGSPLQVSGPAAGLTVLVWEFVQRHGVEALGPVVLVAGVIQLLACVLRLGRWFRAVSPAVILGMLSGIGILIVAGQIHVMVDDVPKGNGIANLLSIPGAVWKGLIPSEDVSHDDAARLGVLTIGLLVAWKFLGRGPLRVVPAPLAAIVAATVVAEFLALPVQRVSMPASAVTALPGPGPDFIPTLGHWEIWLAGVSMAFVASAETLLCAAAVDQLHDGPRTQFNRELAAQGVGNLLCGLAGALPMTGVIVRSAANVEAGARTRLSAILHGLWLLVFVALCPAVLARIPTASLAAVLVYTGCKLANPAAVRSLLAYSRGEAAIFALTVGVIVSVDLLSGVLLGVALSAVKLLYNLSRLSVLLRRGPQPERLEVVLRGTATFLRLSRLAAALETIEPTTEVHVLASSLFYIDHACLELLQNWARQHTATGGAVTADWETLHRRSHRPYRIPEGVGENVPYLGGR